MNNVLLFVIISVVSGIIAGEILSVVNYFVVEPTTDRAIGYETQRDILKGEPVNLNQIHDYKIAKIRNVRCWRLYRYSIWIIVGHCLCIY